MSMFRLSEDQVMMRDLARDLAQKKFKAIAAEIDEEERFPRENIDALAEAGIRLYAGCQGDADTRVAELLAGTLVSADAATCDHHHGEEHTCGDHGCGHHESGHTCGHC